MTLSQDKDSEILVFLPTPSTSHLQRVPTPCRAENTVRAGIGANIYKPCQITKSILVFLLSLENGKKCDGKVIWFH